MLSGEIEELSFRLKNVTDQSVTIEFPSSCRIMVFIETAAGKILYPTSGIFACADVVTFLPLAPNSEHVLSMNVFHDRIIPAIYTGVPLAKGFYRAYAKVEANRGALGLRSPYVQFEVR